MSKEVNWRVKRPGRSDQPLRRPASYRFDPSFLSDVEELAKLESARTGMHIGVAVIIETLTHQRVRGLLKSARASKQ